MRIVFMGTPDFALGSLKALVENHYNVVGVVTVADKPAGRGQKLYQSPVKVYAEQMGIPVLQPVKLKDEAFVEALKALAPDVQIVVAFRMLPEVVWRLPRLGTFNLHASLLPNYRGAAPIAGTLHDKLMTQGAQLVLQTVDSIANGTCQTQPQNKEITYAEAPKIYKETCKINWEANGTAIEQLIRGMSPYPTAWTEMPLNGELLQLKVYDAIFEPAQHNEEVGKFIIEKKTMKVTVKDGYIQLLEVQLPAKKRMKIADMLNGLK